MGLQRAAVDAELGKHQVGLDVAAVVPGYSLRLGACSRPHMLLPCIVRDWLAPTLVAEALRRYPGEIEEIEPIYNP